MGKTVRNVNAHTARYANRVLDGDSLWGGGQRAERNARLMLQGKRHFRSDKCQTAQIDDEGGYKLDTWSECPSKHHGKEAKRKLRLAGKKLIQAQLSC